MNYIEYLKHKIAHLSIRRDKLLESPNSSVLALGNERSGKYVLNRAMVHPCSGGVEIVIITSNADEEVLLLSEVLEILLEEGFCVVTCISTKANESLLYSIKAKVSLMINTPFISRFRVYMKFRINIYISDGENLFV